MKTQWTAWHANPFAAIKEAAETNGTPDDLEKAKTTLAEVTAWPSVDASTMMDDLLQEIAGATNIVVQYDLKGAYRAAYDGDY